MKHALTISVVKFDNLNHQQNRHHETCFVDSRSNYRRREEALVDFHTDFSCDFGYENRYRETRKISFIQIQEITLDNLEISRKNFLSGRQRQPEPSGNSLWN